MMKTRNIRSILLSVILMVSLMLTMLPTAQAAGSFQAVVTSSTMKVYAVKSPHRYLGTLTKGTVVTVEDYSGSAALISLNGYQGIARVSDMKALSSDSEDSGTAGVDTSDAKPVVTTRSTRVYLKPSKSSKYVTVKAGTSMNLVAVNGSYAMVERDGVIGYTYTAHLGDPDAQDSNSDNGASDTTESSEKIAVVTNRATRIYQKASTSSKYVSVPAGMAMNVVAVNGNCARVERNGVIGYAVKSHLSLPSDADTSTGDDSSAGSGDGSTGSSESSNDSNAGSSSDIFDSSASNEQIIFNFLVKVMKYNTAAACGILSNVKYESGFRPTAGGDGGTSYGIVQWHAGRKTKLINWCESNGCDYTTLKGQLYYLQHELTNSYTSVHRYLQNVDNSADGAYNAGYYFCYNFEAPANRASKSVTRGNYARDTLWSRYS